MRAAIGGPFRLQSSSGGVIESASLEGRPFLVFFDFTRCPSICPTTLADLTGLIDDLRGTGQGLPACFVGIGPERDTPEALSAYLGSFGSDITGLTGMREEVARLARAYRAVVQRVSLAGGDGTFNHMALVYLPDERGRFVAAFDPGDDKAAVLTLIRKTLAPAP